MDGPSHYRQAERLADMAHHFTYGDGGDAAVGHALAAEAQVHATLALAAATVMHADFAASAADIRDIRLPEWDEAVGVKPQSKTCAYCEGPLPTSGVAYCRPACRFADDDHGSDEPTGGDE